MKKIYTKLILITLTLLLSMSVVVMSSYAWFVLSSSPVATGIQVTIGGGNTVLIAPDVQQVVDGVTYHYPGSFTDKMNFSNYESYDYLEELGGLMPVSTADGCNWFLPVYYDATDKEVQSGSAMIGTLKDIQDFRLDNELLHANLTADQAGKIKEGSYAYLDFWVVSPGAEYTLRISTGEKDGSYLVDLLEPQKTDDLTGYSLREPTSKAAAAVRIGFLANPSRVTDDTMVYYQSSPHYNSQYTYLQGLYQEPDNGSFLLSSNRFTIYEPNGDSHPYGTASLGSYVHTSPIGLVDGVATEVSVEDRLAVQLTSSWQTADVGSGLAIEQRFQTALYGMDLENMDTREIQDRFYQSYLQGQLSPYVMPGQFVTRTSDLYKYTNSIAAEQMDALAVSGATEDTYIIRLERNVPQRIRMFVWLEGQDVDCVDEISSGRFAVNIELAGGTE